MTIEQEGDVMDYLAAIPISNARMLGVKIFGVGLAILAVNVVALLTSQMYGPFILPFAFPALLGGLSLLLVGQPRSASGTPALWGRVVLVMALTIGAGVGIAAAILLLAPPR